MSLIDPSESDIASTRRSGGRVVTYGLIAIVAILGLASFLLFWNLASISASEMRGFSSGFVSDMFIFGETHRG